MPKYPCIPDQILTFHNEDKTFHEKTPSNGIMTHPYTAIITGKVGCGKRNLVFNIVAREKDGFDRIIIVHLDIETQEYNILTDHGAELTDVIPNFDEFDVDEKTLVIIDEIDVSALKKDELSRLQRLFLYCASHRNLSLFLVFQQIMDIPPKIRRSAMHYFVFKTNDKNVYTMLASRLSLPTEDLKYIMKNIITDNHDFLWVNMSKFDENGYPELRKNLFHKIILDG